MINVKFKNTYCEIYVGVWGTEWERRLNRKRAGKQVIHCHADECCISENESVIDSSFGEPLNRPPKHFVFTANSISYLPLATSFTLNWVALIASPKPTNLWSNCAWHIFISKGGEGGSWASAYQRQLCMFTLTSAVLVSTESIWMYNFSSEVWRGACQHVQKKKIVSC